MSFCYLASFDVLDLRNGFGEITFRRSGSSSFVVELALADAPSALGSAPALVFNHYSDSEWIDIVAVDASASIEIRRSLPAYSFSTVITSMMRTGAANASWPDFNTLTCTFSTTTFRYVFTYPGDAFDEIEFSNAATRNLFGFTGVNPTAGETVTADTTPMFAVQPELDAVSTPNAGDGIDYEPQQISASTIAAMGAQFGITRSCVPTYRDWTQQSEPREKVLRFAAQLSGGPKFSHQELFENCRCVLPFVVVDGFGDGQDYLMRLRPDTCLWSSATCKRAANDMDDAHFDVRYGAQVLGVFV